MIRFNIAPKISRQCLLTATAIVLFAGTQGALAGGGGGHFGDHDGMRGHESSDHNEGMKTHESRGDRDRGDTGSNLFRDRGDRHPDSDRRAATKDKERGKGNTPGTAGTGAPGTAGNNTIHPIVTNKPTHPAANTPADIGHDKTPGTVTGAPAPGTTGNNTIHPIVTNNPAPTTANAPVATGKLPPSDPVGNTHPTVGSSPPTVVTVSNGVTTTQIQNGLGGVSVYSDKPGTITVTNGKESTTLSGASVTLSGNVVGVGGGQGVEVGPRNGEGKTVVAVKPPPAKPLPNGGANDLKGGGDPAVDVLNGVSDFGYGVTHGFAPGSAPPPATSTIQQQ